MRSQIVLLALILQFVLSNMTSLHAEDESWREFEFESKITKEIDKKTYSTLQTDTITKKDIFIFRKNVHINDILRSNGGDVTIVADSVYINAPIDTRPYLDLKYIFWEPVLQYGRYYGLPGTYDVGVIESFNSLYLWKEEYDAATKTYRYASVSGVTSYKNEKEYIGKFISTPQLPHAPLPRVKNGIRRLNGSDAPDQISWEDVRAGTIRIYASEIRFCDLCLSALEQQPSPPSAGDPYDRNRSVFLQASGLKGGRGGAGMLGGCTTHRTSQTDACVDDFNRRGALSGKPGRGGDAGSVFLTYVGRTPTRLEITMVGLATRVKGGEPAQKALQRTPKYMALRNAKSRSAFTDEVPIENIDKLYGRDGELIIKTVNSDEALSEIINFLLMKEIEGNYSISSMLRQYVDKPEIFSYSPMGMLSIFLEESLTALQLQLLEALPESVAGKPRNLESSQFLSTVSCQTSEMSGYDIDTQRLLTSICYFTGPPDIDFVKSYLFNVGGIYKEKPIDVNVGIRHDDLIRKLTQVSVDLKKVLDEQKGLRLFIYEKVTQDQMDKMASEIQRLDDIRKRIQDEVEKRRKDHAGFEAMMQPLIKIGDGVGKIYKTFIAGEWGATGRQVFVVANDVAALRLTEYGLPKANTGDLESRIDDLKIALRKFSESVQKTRKDMVESALINIREVIDARNELRQRRLEMKFRVPNLVRASLQEYIRSGKNAEDDLRWNLNMINKSITEALAPSQLNVSVTANDCNLGNADEPNRQPEDSLRCIKIPAGEKALALVVEGDWMKGFPLYVRDAKGRAIAVDIDDGFISKDVSFEELLTHDID